MKRATMILMILSFAIITHAQTAYVFGSLGYGFGYGGYTNETLFRSFTQTDEGVRNVEDHYFNYGRGIKFDVGGWYALMEDIGVQGAIGLSFGVPDYNIEQEINDINYELEYNFFVFSIKAQIVPRFTVIQLLDMYIGVGTGLYFAGLSYEGDEEGSFDSRAALGFNGMVGADLPIMDDLSVFGEIGFEQVSFTLEQQEITRTNFPDREEGTFPFERDSQNLSAPPKIPGSNWGIRIGIRYWLF